MKVRAGLVAAIACAVSGCGDFAGTLVPAANSANPAAIVGSLVTNAKSDAFGQSIGCPEAVVTLNGNAVDLTFDDGCTFVINEVQPAEVVFLRVEIAELGVAGTIELTAVEESELIELLVEASDESITISVIRRTQPAAGVLPSVITGNNTSIQLEAGIAAQDLTVEGNNFLLTGVSGGDCGAEGWSIIQGAVLVEGNNATFHNVTFDGQVTVRGNNARFINCCFGDTLVVFGNNLDVDQQLDIDIDVNVDVDVELNHGPPPHGPRGHRGHHDD